ncbi:MAG TPA: CYCXC family (seleno)protein [Candidatus Binataceae bacterium]|nr:CYCXC family (seleno)protein [Candidatus Binataceae bacterium]
MKQARRAAQQLGWVGVVLALAFGPTLLAYAQSAKPVAPSCCIRSSGPSHDRPVLNPSQFNGPIRQAYQVAKDHPDLLVQLHCYCGCDKSAGHKNLLDCYRDLHGATCGICTGEALEAARMFDQGASIEAIRAALKSRFGNS